MTRHRARCRSAATRSQGSSLSSTIRGALLLLLALSVGACSEQAANQLDAVKRAGKLIVLTHSSPTAYYEGPEGFAGFEYDMVRGFADSLRVELELVVPERLTDIGPLLASGKAHVAVGVPVTPEQEAFMRFGPSYQQLRHQVVYRLGTQPPTSTVELAGRQIEVVRGSSEAEHLRTLRQRHADLDWTEVEGRNSEELLRMVWAGLLELTVVDSNLLALTQKHYPELRVAFSLEDTRSLAWAFSPGPDDTLYKTATHYLNKFRHSGKLAQLTERYYGNSGSFDYINLAVFRAQIRTRLPLYQRLFEQAGQKYGLDWRLLAAVGYQESYWDPHAVSPTGVRGVMMLTGVTAEHLGVDDRIDPAQSIDGGARYLRSLIDRVPPGIPPPDRTWMALAAYNVGIHHLEDARLITQRRNRHPDRWGDVKLVLPLLSQAKWYTKTRYGHARGTEAVRFVGRVRTYYDVLVKAEEDRRVQARIDPLSLKAPAI